MFLSSPVWITAKWKGATARMMIEEKCGAGTYGPGGDRTYAYLGYLCVHAYTVRHSEPDTHCIRFEDYSCAKHMAYPGQFLHL